MAAPRTENRTPRVVILGGGFGGLYCARALRRVPVQVTLVDRGNHHLFQPLLYQVATASLSPGDIASPLRHVLRGQRNVVVWMGEAIDVDVEARAVVLADGMLTYDWLVVATGATHTYFGHDDWAEHAPGLKTVDDALEIRRRFLLAFEAAEREDDPRARERLLTFVVVGAGPTGVELAGAMAEIARTVMPRDFRFIDTRMARILLLEAGPRVLPSYPPDLSEKARRQLERLGVEVRTGAMVTGVEDGAVVVGQERMEAENVFWAAGVQASPLGARLGAPLDRAGRVIVEPDLSVPGRPEIFVVGDLARAGEGQEVVPGVAQGALQGGRHVAGQIRRALAGRDSQAFRYRDRGNLATIGRAAAVADLPGGLRLRGFVAWVAWLVLHLFQLVGFKNRGSVLASWVWNYLAYDHAARVIVDQREAETAETARGDVRRSWADEPPVG